MLRGGFSLGLVWRPGRHQGGRHRRPHRQGPRLAPCTQLLSNFLPPNDRKRPVLQCGLDSLGVAYERIRAPYGAAHHLEAVYYPADDNVFENPLIVLAGGFDSTLQELYFVLVKVPMSAAMMF